MEQATNVPETSRSGNLGDYTLGETIDLYMMAYAGRDASMGVKLRWWKARLGDRTLARLTEDELEDAMEALAREPAVYYAGKGKDGSPIWRNKGIRSPATLNHYTAALGGVLKFARRKRITPRGWVSPLKAIEREPESPGKLRYLSQDEYARLPTSRRSRSCSSTAR